MPRRSLHWKSGLLSLILMTLLVACGQATAPAATTAPSAEATTAPSAEATTAPSAEATTAPSTEATPAANNGIVIKIGSKNFTESILVAEMYALVLEDQGFTVERTFSLGAISIVHTAMLNGEIDLYPEYTSTGLLQILKQQPIPDEPGIMAALRKGYEEQFKLTWLQPAPYNNSNTFALTKAKADELGVVTFSDLVPFSDKLRLGGPPEFPEREDNKAVLALYGFDPKFGGENYVQLDAGGLRYDALSRGDIDVVVAFGTDGQIAGLNLVVLKDDKNAYPIYQVAPVINQAVLAANPSIADALNAIAPTLTNEVISDLNWQVDGPEKKEIAVVAREFLVSQGLIK